MEKPSLSSLRSSSAPEELLAAAALLISTKPAKSTIKTLIYTSSPSSPLLSSLPSALHLAISRSLEFFKNPSSSSGRGGTETRSPPSKRPRRSTRIRPSDDGEEGLSPNSKPRSRSETLNPLLELRACAYVAHLCVSHPKKPFSPSDLLPAVRSLHDSLVLFEADAALLSEVASLCEDWWKEGALGRETLISQSLPYLLSKSLTEGKKKDVRRVYSLREAFLLFDYLDESIEDMKLLIVRCMITPVYLKTEEGRRFIAFMLGLNSQLTKEALALIKSQIPFGRKSVLEAYADIIFRSWKGSEGSLREEIENDFLQGLIEGAIHASSRSLAASVRRVLSGFLEQRATDVVEKLLFRLTEPVIFRSLQVANSSVRLNALHLLLDMFPLEDPDLTKEFEDALLDKQFFLLEKLLLDDCPDIRAVAVEGSFRILRLFWEVLPSPIITKFLTKTFDDISHDTCNEVRLSAVRGIIYLLDNPQSHEVLKVLLPRFGGMFSDRALHVRVAFADLLLVIRDIRKFQFNKVVSLEALLSSLANDHPSVAQKVTRLLIPSYFPSKLTAKEACSRCIALLKRSPSAGARFCEFAFAEGSSSKSLMELLRICSRLALSPKELSSDQIDGLLVGSASICRSLSSNPLSKTTLRELFPADKLKCLLTSASSHHAKAAVLSIAADTCPDNLTGFLSQCMLLIMDCAGLSENVEKQAMVRAIHKLMFSHGWFDDLFGTLTNIVQTIASRFLDKYQLRVPEHVLQSMKKKKVPVKASVKSFHSNGRGSPCGISVAEVDFARAAAVAWQMKDLLSDTVTRNAVLKSPTLEVAYSALGIICQVSFQHFVHWESLDTSPALAYTTFAMFIALQDVDLAAADNLDGVACSTKEHRILDASLNQLLCWAEKLFSHPGTNSSSQMKDYEARSDLSDFKRMQNALKISTSALKFVIDAAIIGLTANSQVRCLKFASSYVRHFISCTEGLREVGSTLSEEEYLKDVLHKLRSSFTYIAKFVHLVLKRSTVSSGLPLEVFYLCNDLLDLIVCVETSIGSSYASHILRVAKPWLPVLILGLASGQLMTREAGRPRLYDLYELKFPSWLAALAKAELQDVNELTEDQHIPQVEESVCKKLINMVVLLLKKGNTKVLDAVGNVLLSGIVIGLENADFSLVLGLVRLTCMKLLGKGFTQPRELDLMFSSLQEIFIRIGRDLGDTTIDEGGRHMLESARRVLKSILVYQE